MRFPSDPYSRIFGGVALGIVPLGAWSVVASGGSFEAFVGFLLFLVIGTFIGPFYGVWYTFSVDQQWITLAIFGAVVATITAGFKYKHRVLGQIGVTIGIPLWIVFGMGSLGVGA